MVTLTRHFYDMSNMMSRNEGVWLSNGWVKTLLWIFLPCLLYTIFSIVYFVASYFDHCKVSCTSLLSSPNVMSLHFLFILEHEAVSNMAEMIKLYTDILIVLYCINYLFLGDISLIMFIP